MKFEILRDKENKKYIMLNEIKLCQGLIASYSITNNKFIILDPDKKDYKGVEYTDKIKLADKEYGIVQQIDEEAILKLAELHKIIRVLK